MKKDSGIFRLLFASLILLLGSVGSAGAVPVNGCGTLNTPGETYVLSNDISTSGTCFTIGADGITLDGAGYSITGDGSGYDYGVYLNWRSEVTVENLNVGEFYSGISLYSSSNNNLTNNNVSNNNNGIFLGSSSSNTLTGNTANSNNRGINLDSSSNNTITGNTANSNNWDGIWLESSSSNTLTGNTAKGNSRYDVYIWASSGAECNNIVENNTGSDDRPIKYFNRPVNLQDEVLSELILCNADNSNINNVTIKGSATKKNNGLFVFRTDNSNFTNINSSDNWQGVSLYSSNSNTLTNNTVNSNTNGGINLDSSNNNTLTNNTANSNTNGGINLDSSNSNTITNNNALNNYYGLNLYSSNNNTIANNNASNNKGGWGNSGIYLSSSNNNTLTDNTANSNNKYGIYLRSSSDYNTLTDNIVNSNTNGGVSLHSSNSNTLTNNTVNSNNQVGIILYDSSNNTLTDNNASNNYWSGIYLGSSIYNTITGSTVNSNYNWGMFLSSSGSNTITGSTVNSNSWGGINLDSSNSNTITNNNANSNNNGGINLYNSSSNTIYNNLFNNTANFNFRGTTTNTWNTTKTLGTNVIGGSYIGGNFWANPSGTGFSEQCADSDGDGICDSSYTLASGNVDYLPLTLPPVAGTNLYLSKQAPASKDRGSMMTYTLYYHNLGDTAAQDVVLEDTLPVEVEFISASDSGSYDLGTGKVTWNLGSLESRGHGYENVTVRISQNTTVGTVIQNDANISTSTTEVRYDDNEAYARTSVTGSSLPPDVGVEPNNGGGGTPSVYYGTPITFSYQNSTATGVDIRIQIDDGGSDITGGMTGGPPEWTYTTTFYPRHGRATITYMVSGGLNVTFNIYIDPAGYIYDADTGERIENATVWLQHPDGLGGWENVPTGEAIPIAQPDINPQITGADGQYQWDVLAGSYRVHVEASGYYPEDSIVVSIPPPVTDLHVGLTRIPTGPTQIGSCAAVNSSGVYVLNQSITNSGVSGACINITSSDVIFDGRGYTIDGVDTSFTSGVYVYSTTPLTNVTVKNLVATDWASGIYYRNAQNGSIENNTANSNTGSGEYTGYGIVLDSSSNNTITNNTANSNTGSGEYTGYGIVLYSSSNNTITNNIANSNNWDGIRLSSSSNNTVTNNTASNNRGGIKLLFSSNDNAIYNNFFNNTYNFDFYNIGLPLLYNSWNFTKTSGTNVIGGPYLGGNFWANPSGTGFSETCTDVDADGICDSNYTLTSGNVDYLPLSLNFVPSTTTTTSTTTTSTTTTSTTSTTSTTVPSQTTVVVDNATAPPMGDTIVFMTIENVLDIGVADITLVYDRSVVQVLNVTSGDFDFMDAAIDNANGVTRTGAMQTVNPGLNGSVVLASILLKAVGSIGECSALNLSINELKAVGPPEASIPATVVNGMFCIEETTPPAVTNPSANPQSIPEDTDNDPTCAGTPYSEFSQLTVTVIDDSGVLSVATNLSAIGGRHDQPMSNISDTWTATTNASIGSAIYNGTDYLPHYLRVNATDIYNNSNSSMSIPLTVIKNGDVNEDGDTTLYDAMYLARNVLGKPGFETITPGIADVSGDCSKGIYDAMYLAKNVLDKPGFETLR